MARGQVHLTLVVKATYALVHGAEMTPETPEPIVAGEIPHGGDPARSVRVTSDLAAYIPGADVLLTGHAYAPRGRPAPMVAVHLALYGDRPFFDKVLHVHGDRDGGGEPQPFEAMPLVYERAYGGPGWEPNPVGVGFGAAAGRQPNVVLPQTPNTTAGFGPISAGWPSRTKVLRPRDYEGLRRPIPELADDFDWTYYHAAPPDQRTPPLRGDEWIVLEGVHPDQRLLKCRLPGVQATAQLHGLKAPETATPVELRADTLRIDSDARRCTVVWRGVTPLPAGVRPEALRAVVAVERRGTVAPSAPKAEPRGSGPGPESVPSSTASRRPADLDFSGTVAISEADVAPLSRPVVPFAPPTPDTPASSRDPRGPAAPAVAGAPWSGARAAPAPASSAFEGTMDLTAHLSRPAAAPSPPAKHTGTVVDTGTTPVRSRPMPFVPAAKPAPAPAPAAPVPVPGAPWSKMAAKRVDSPVDFEGTMALSPDDVLLVPAAAPPPPPPSQLPVVEAAPAPVVEAAPAPVPLVEAPEPPPPPVTPAAPEPSAPAAPVAPAWSWAAAPAAEEPPRPARPAPPAPPKRATQSTLYGGGFGPRKK
jgi:hypothetical protein